MALTKPQCDVSRGEIVGIDQINEKTKESLTIVRLFCFACFPSSIYRQQPQPKAPTALHVRRRTRRLAAPQGDRRTRNSSSSEQQQHQPPSPTRTTTKNGHTSPPNHPLPSKRSSSIVLSPLWQLDRFVLVVGRAVRAKPRLVYCAIGRCGTCDGTIDVTSF